MNPGLQPGLWHDLFAAFATACAALLGLFFVAISLHLRELQDHPLELYRAQGGLQGLGVGLAISLFVLIPAQSLVWLGTELIAAELAFLVVNIPRGRRAFRMAGRTPAVSQINIVVGIIGILATIGAGISLIAGQGPGLYLVVPNVLMIVLFGSWFAWGVLFAAVSSPAKPR